MPVYFLLCGGFRGNVIDLMALLKLFSLTVDWGQAYLTPESITKNALPLGR